MSSEDNRVVFINNFVNLRSKPLPLIFSGGDAKLLNLYLRYFHLLYTSHLFRIKGKLVVHAKTFDEVSLLVKVLIGYSHLIPIKELESLIIESSDQSISRNSHELSTISRPYRLIIR